MSPFWRDRPTLVTGGSGLLGSWLVERLLQLEADVVCLLRDWVPRSELVRRNHLERVAVVRGDVRDQDLMERALGEYEIRTVFHLAAQTTVGVANRNPVSTFDANIRGTWSLLEACRRSPLVAQILVASSDKAYGAHPKLPYTEDAPLQGRHPYDVSKSCADLIAQSYAVSYRTPVAVVRCGNLYGGGDLNWNRLIPGTIRSVLRGETPIIRSDGTCVRDYLYVEDGVSAYVQLAEALADRRELTGEAFNFGHNRPLSVRAVAEMLLALMKRADLGLDVRNEATNEIPDQYLDATKARTVLGWTPSCTVEQGLERTIHWYTELLGAS
jgi:CDP-glucose 4,6-dehydratase